MRVLVVDDHPVFLGALKSILEAYFDDFAIDGKNSLEEALSVSFSDFDLVIVDLSFRGKDITRDVCGLIEANLGTKFLVLTNFEDGRHVRMIADTHARGYLPKSTPAEILTSVVQLVSLKVNLGTTQSFGHARREIQRAWASYVVRP